MVDYRRIVIERFKIIIMNRATFIEMQFLKSFKGVSNSDLSNIKVMTQSSTLAI